MLPSPRSLAMRAQAGLEVSGRQGRVWNSLCRVQGQWEAEGCRQGIKKGTTGLTPMVQAGLEVSVLRLRRVAGAISLAAKSA